MHRPTGEAHPVGVAGLAPAFVGRKRELAELAQALSRPPAVVLVEGEAGIGKSRLLQEFLASPARLRLETLVAVCPPFRDPFTLGPIVDALRQAAETVRGLRFTALVGALRPMFPEWADHLPPTPEPLEDATAGRHRLFRALAELLRCLDVGVLVVEDVHWADEATLEFLLFLTSRRPRSISVVVSYRPEDVPPESLLLRLSSRLPAGTTQVRVTLEPLAMPATAGLVSSMLDGGSVSEALARFLHQRTEGLPLAVEESVRLLQQRADLVLRDGQWARRSLDDLPVPPTVRDSVLERVPRLSPAAQRVLQAAAVLGQAADETLLAQLAGLTGEPARAALTEAVGSGLLGEREHRKLAFRHVLMGAAVYEAIPGTERRRLHRAAGATLEQRTPRQVSQLTRHFREAQDTAKWCRYADQAAELAIASGDSTAAVALLNELLAGAELPLATRARLARKLAIAAIYCMEAMDDLVRHAVGTLQRIRDTPELGVAEQGEIGGRLGRLLLQLGEFEAGRVELERAVAQLGHNPVEAARAMTSLGFPVAPPWPARVHLRWLQRASELMSDARSPAEWLPLTVNRVTALLQLGEPRGWAVAAELPTDPASPQERQLIALGNLNIGDAAMRWGRFAEARQRLASAQQLASSNRHSQLRDHVLISQAHLDWFTGAWEGLPERVAAFGERDDVDPKAGLEATLVAALLHAAGGARRRAEEQLRYVLGKARGRTAAAFPLEPAAALARSLLLDGHVDDALRLTGDPMQTVTAKRIWIWATDIAPVRIEALVAAGEIPEATRLVAAFAAGLRGRDAPAPRAALAACRALLAESRGDQVRAAAAYARASAAWARLPRPYDALLSRERQASCLLAADQPEVGLQLLSGVLRDLTGLGAHGDADRVAARLRELGVEAPRPWRGGRRGFGDQLSPRELEVVRLVMAGQTNRRIAETLSRSPNTVATQLKSAMRKLNVSSRTALAVSVIEAQAALDQPPSGDRR
ncbi:MAG: AAA family ATPase [Micromonosporaceae bacterium]|nr:AAA family ATPase [Micromonosporaceae bacterium]